MQSGQLSLAGKRVLELGCGHGLPGIFTCLKGACAVHFQDFNAEVLQCLTIPNVNANIQQNLSATDDNNSPEVRFFASDWNEAHQILPHVPADDSDTKNSQTVDEAAGYDIILMAETVYSVSTLPGLYKLVKKCLRSSHGVVYLAAKKYYFGVGGGSRRFISIVEKDGILAASLVAEVTDGSSNLREVWKLHFK
ncbi:uncharacterized protein LOC132039632 [Lycium ferocissimum]|uniref:uncharacterized protein LOC132039632 n=1 Tax=Lycium ferocissimum TaxID=112874 RepID=UPI0028152742|nr:uncharacterized protein LOC132039632 [Lycium ferocissimum]